MKAVQRPSTAEVWHKQHQLRVQALARANAKRRPQPVVGRMDRAIVDMICDEIENIYGVAPTKLSGRRGFKSVSWARHVAIYLCRQMTDLSLREIVWCFGRADHTTAVNALKRVKAEITQDAVTARLLQNMQARVTERWGEYERELRRTTEERLIQQELETIYAA